MKDKDLKEIRPARGVKINKKVSNVVQKPKIIKDVQPPNTEVPPASEEVTRIVIENNRAKANLIEAIKEVNRLMNNRVLSENRSVKQNDEEKQIITNLVNAAIILEELSPGEGLLGMATLAVRQGLSLRDAGNELAYELERTRKELFELQNTIDKLKEDLKQHDHELWELRSKS